MQVTPELLSTFPCLKPLPRGALNALAQESMIKKFARRQVVLNAGKREHYLCFLFEGRLQGVDFTIDGREVGLYFVEPGDFCGELGMFDDGPQPEYVIARAPALVVFVPMAGLQRITLNHAIVLRLLGERLAARVRQMTEQRSLLGLPNINQRVCCQLWMLIPEAQRNTLLPATLTSAPTHMELAIMLNLSRESVSRVFQLLQTRKVVRRDGPGTLLIDDLRTLRAYAEGRRDLS